MTATRFGFFH